MRTFSIQPQEKPSNTDETTVYQKMKVVKQGRCKMQKTRGEKSRYLILVDKGWLYCNEDNDFSKVGEAMALDLCTGKSCL